MILFEPVARRYSSLENAEKIQKLDASPFESLDKSTGTYVLKPEYQGYGATIE